MFKLVVLSSVLALAAASPSAIGLGLGGLGLTGLAGPIGVPLGAHIAAPLAAPIAAHGVVVAPALAAAPVLGHAYNYRGPLSLAPGQPANILAADGRPLDTLSVNLDRAAHLTARAVSGHLLRKRSAPLLAPAAALSYAARIDIPSRVIAPALPAVASAWPAARIGWGAPVAAPLGVGAIGHAGLIGHLG
ncbi:unnamed protein product [Diatraea saccharalis]|uniref:Cuticle protein n=1 Tax=Diatraea saccharalis TaxID=40085 RepID=A0A9N9RCY3_9NEOP|nr:unnamed protein product [Diatraea saccharalis]